MDNIQSFIKEFKHGHNEKALVKSFTNGNCYHFARVLADLFKGYIIYDEVIGHFMFFSLDTYFYYDITGKVKIDTTQYMSAFSFLDNESCYHPKTDALLAERLANQCVYLLEEPV